MLSLASVDESKHSCPFAWELRAAAMVTRCAVDGHIGSAAVTSHVRRRPRDPDKPRQGAYAAAALHATIHQMLRWWSGLDRQQPVPSSTSPLTHRHRQSPFRRTGAGQWHLGGCANPDVTNRSSNLGLSLGRGREQGPQVRDEGVWPSLAEMVLVTRYQQFEPTP